MYSQKFSEQEDSQSSRILEREIDALDQKADWPGVQPVTTHHNVLKLYKSLTKA